MADANLTTIFRAGLIMAFILPGFASISNTLPAPPTPPGGVNVTYQLNQTGNYIYKQFSLTYINSSYTLLGECGAPLPNGIPGFNSSIATAGGKNCTSNNQGLYANIGYVQAFAFVLNGLGPMMTDIIQLPYLDWLSLNVIVGGMYTVLPGFPIGLLIFGANLIYLYMAFSMLMMGIGLIQKYNPKVG